MTYDAAGRVLSSTDPSGQISTFTYNTLGQPLTVATPAKGAAPAETITYTYDTNGRTLTVHDNRGTTTMTYENGNDFVHSVTDPVTGTTTYTYRLSGERKTMTLPGGGTWTYTYNADLRAAGLPSLSCNEALPKDDPNSIANTLAMITDDQGRQVKFQYDYVGRLLATASDQVYTTQGSAVSEVLTTYNLTGEYNWAQGQTNSIPPNCTASGELLGVTTTFEWQEGSGSSTAWRSRLLSSNAYTYDDLGNRLTNTLTTASVTAAGSPQYSGGSPAYGSSQNDAFSNACTPATNQVTTTRTETYTYDSLNHLKTVNYGDGQTQTYGFDAMGNRLSKQDSSTGTTNYGYNAANMLLSTTGTGASSYSNDADGNTLTGGGRTNTWDSQNRLVSCIITGNSSTFQYGADGLRRQKTTNGTTTDYAYDGTMMVREGVASGGTLSQVKATYLIGPRGPEYRRDDTQMQTDGQGHTFNGKASWYVYDGLGSVVGEVDPLGNLTSSPKYDVYGAVRSNGGTASSKQGFVGALGHLSEAETGLVYMRARYYDPQAGRFVSEDPGKSGANWFIYCNNNPINMVDRDGRVAGFIGELLEELELPFKLTTGSMAGGIFLALLSAYDNYQYIAHQGSPDRDDGRNLIGGILGILAGLSAGIAGAALLGAAGIGAGILGLGLLCVAVVAMTMGAIAVGLALDNLDGNPPITESSG